MSIIGYIIIGIIIIILSLVYLLFLLSYIGSSKSYREAKRVNAIVEEELGNMKLATGSHSIGSPRYRTFYKYKVSFIVDGTEYIEEAELKESDLKVGDSVEVRYSISKKGKLSLESEAFLCWTREIAIGYILGIILGVVLSILKVNDII